MGEYSRDLKNCIADSQEEGSAGKEMGGILQVRNAYRVKQWKQIIQECRRSGLSNKAYCQQRGISEKTYYYWLRKVRTAAAEQAAPQIMEIEPEPAERVEMLYIRYRGAELKLPAETDMEAVAAVLRSVQQL